MYVPSVFREDDAGVLFGLMESHGFATLITTDASGMTANHFPLLVDRWTGPHGTLLGHMARSNPQWKSFRDGSSALAIFQGPHTYVSPSWYGPGIHVPTWNYAAIHAIGTPRAVEDPVRLRAILDATVEKYEARYPTPWKLDLPPEGLDPLLQAIVGFEIPIERLDGKLKLSQNRTDEDRLRVMKTLCQSLDPSEKAVGDLMRATAKP